MTASVSRVLLHLDARLFTNPIIDISDYKPHPREVRCYAPQDTSLAW